MERTDEANQAPISSASTTRFTGEFNGGTDVKGRVLLPAVFRECFIDGGVLTPWQGLCLAAFPRDHFESYVQSVVAQIKLLAEQGREEDPQGIYRSLHRASIQFRLDTQGRLIVPETLRERHGLSGGVTFIGVGDRVEMWPEFSPPDGGQDADNLLSLASIQSGLLGAGF